MLGEVPMQKPDAADETAGQPAPPSKSRHRVVPRRRGGEQLPEPVSPVQRPSTVIFDASPTTIAASLAKAGSDAPEAALTWTADRVAVEVPDGADRAAPVFVFGGEPDEHDLLREVLDAHPSLHCGSEAAALAQLARGVKDNWETALVHLGYPEQYWFRYVAVHFDSLRTAEVRAAGKRGWVQFVGDADLPLDTLDRLFPRARVVHLVGGGVSFNRKAAAVRHAAARLSAGRYLEVTGGELTGDAHATVRRILAFLGEAV
jgi:hypothetical protein